MQEQLFILGREPELSVAELEAVFGSRRVRVVNHSAAMILGASDERDAIDRLGGTVKIAEILAESTSGLKAMELLDGLAVDRLLSVVGTGGRDIGFSFYGGTRGEREELRRYAFRLKKIAREHGRLLRIVTSREPQLSSVTIERQGLLKHGAEIVVCQGQSRSIIGRTTAVQNFREYGRRDRGRPAADPKRGMIPPKLAQMMLNIGGLKRDDVLLDPFMGVGTIVQEATLLGVKTVIGSDIDGRAVRQAQDNIRWLLKEYPKAKVDVHLIGQNALHSDARPTLIVTEPDLGRPLRGSESLRELEAEAVRLERLYLQVFQHWQRILQPGGRIVMIWPRFVHAKGIVTISLESQIANLGLMARELLSAESAAGLGCDSRMVLTYARANARVSREIRIWTKK